MSTFSFFKLFAVTVTIFLCACSSTPAQKLLGFKKGETKFTLSEINFTLIHEGAERFRDPSVFANEEEMKETLRKFLTIQLTEKNLLDNSSPISVSFDVNYVRTYNYGGKSLNKPKITYQANFFKDGALIGSRSYGPFTTKFSYLKDNAAYIKIAAFQWDKEEEPQDLEAVALGIASDLAKTGD